MTTSEIQRMFHAGKSIVFEAISNIENLSSVVPEINNTAFLSDQKVGVGTKFRETRKIRGRNLVSELEVIDYLENKHIRILSDHQGTIRDCLNTVEQKTQDTTRLTLIITIKPCKFLAKIKTPLIKGLVEKVVVNDLNAIKDYCERRYMNSDAFHQ